MQLRLTLFGRSLCLLVSEVLANAVCWIVAGLLFGKHTHRESVLSLALLAWVRLHTVQMIEFLFSYDSNGDHRSQTRYVPFSPVSIMHLMYA